MIDNAIQLTDTLLMMLAIRIEAQAHLHNVPPSFVKLIQLLGFHFQIKEILHKKVSTMLEQNEGKRIATEKAKKKDNFLGIPFDLGQSDFEPRYCKLTPCYFHS